MQRSKTWITMDNEIGIEVGRDATHLHLVMETGWPFPAPPVRVPRKECRLLDEHEQQDMTEQYGEAPF